VLAKLRNELRHPAVIAEYARTYAEERSRLAQRATKDRARFERRLALAQAELERAFKALTRGIVPEDVAEKQIAALRAERESLKAKLEATRRAAESPLVLHPAALTRYEGQLSRLQEVLAAGSAAGDTEATAAIRDIVETVTVRPDPERRGGVLIEIVGRLNALLRDSAHSNKQRPLSVGKMVAGAGIEPATYGL